MVCLEGEEYAKKNLASMERSEFLAVVGGYSTSGVMGQLKDLQMVFENETRGRLSTLAPQEIVYLVRIFSQAESASPEFYAIMDKHIGLHLSGGKNLEPTLLFPLLKSFYDSGHARPKLFIKLQQVVVNSLASLDTNEVCALLRLYAEMEIQQTTFYENIGQHLESRLSELDETGLINALQGFKSQ
jgi:hypothetical protein